MSIEPLVRLCINVSVSAIGALVDASPNSSAIALLWFAGLCVSGIAWMMRSRRHRLQAHNLETNRQLAVRQQADRYQQVQQFNAALEREVQLRTAQLQLISEFEITLKRITDKVRDSLDEAQILQTAVYELGVGMGVGSCNAGLYDLDTNISTIAYEYNPSILSLKGHVVPMADEPQIYKQLLAGETFQFCALQPHPLRGRIAILACPIVSDQGALGDLWLTNDRDYGFRDLDLRLVQQVATQCAIALRQARLFRATQAQVQELERLNRLKDDFLSTVSHELRTPVSNMKMSIRMLELSLQTYPANPASAKTTQYLRILRDECEREISLINDLLDVQRLETGNLTFRPTTICLQSWLPLLVARFEQRARDRQQTLNLMQNAPLSELWTDAEALERVLTELLNNACKYTPPGEQITVISAIDADVVQFQVRNTGAEISPDDLPHIFEKFYRVVGSDRWKQGGTGLGLTLIQKLVDGLGGAVQIESRADQTTVTVELPDATAELAQADDPNG